MPNLLKDLKIPLITVLFAFLCFYTYTKFAGPIPFFVNSVTTTKESLFSVDGKGEVTTIPDTAMLDLGITKSASTVSEAQTQANIIINKITNDLKALGIEEKNIKTTNYSVSPDYDYNSGRQTIKSYTVNTSVEVKIQPIDKANNALDLATADGANIAGGVQFVLDDQKQKELENTTRKEAIANAKEKAQDISQAAGIKLGRIVDVKEIQNIPGPFPVMMKASSADAGGESTSLNPGENKITVDVTLSYETY